MRAYIFYNLGSNNLYYILISINKFTNQFANYTIAYKYFHTEFYCSFRTSYYTLNLDINRRSLVYTIKRLKLLLYRSLDPQFKSSGMLALFCPSLIDIKTLDAVSISGGGGEGSELDFFIVTGILLE